MTDTQKTSSGDVVLSWREYLASVINPLREEVVNLKDAISKLSVNDSEFVYLRQQCEKHKAKIENLENRIEKLEQYHSVGMWAFRLFQGVAVAVAIAAIVSMLLG